MNDEVAVGKVEHCTGFDRKELHEIDLRIGARLAEKEIYRAEYLRGFFDCFYIALFLALGIYIWFSIGEEN